MGLKSLTSQGGPVGRVWVQDGQAPYLLVAVRYGACPSCIHTLPTGLSMASSVSIIFHGCKKYYTSCSIIYVTIPYLWTFTCLLHFNFPIKNNDTMKSLYLYSFILVLLFLWRDIQGEIAGLKSLHMLNVNRCLTDFQKTKNKINKVKPTHFRNQYKRKSIFPNLCHK